MTVGAIIGEALIIHKLAKTRREFEDRVVELLETVGLQRRPHAPLSARVLRRPAPAHRHRARAGRRAQADRLRRAGLRARRLDPGAGHQPAGGPAGEVRPHLSLHRPRPVGGRAHQHARRGDVSRPHRRDRAARATSMPRRCIPTPRRCCRRCRSPIPHVKRQRILLQGDVPEPDQPADRLPFPHALPDPQVAALQPGDPAAQARRRRALGRLPSPGRRQYARPR